MIIYYSSIKGNESKVGHTDEPGLLPTEAKTGEFENPETDETLEEQQSSVKLVHDKIMHGVLSYYNITFLHLYQIYILLRIVGII